MKTRTVITPASRVGLGFARADITPPVGMYHPVWGAARHTRSTGIHRPLCADVIVVGPMSPQETPGGPAWVRVNVDLGWLPRANHDRLVAALAAGAGVPEAAVDVAYSHTHAAGRFEFTRYALPGGELIAPYLSDLTQRLGAAAERARSAMAPAVISYATATCGMAANRDCWDEQMQGYVCGFNPDVPADGTVLTARVTDGDGELVLSIVNYACHPTTLAWDNTRVSPDYVGAVRERVESQTGRPCSFALAPCGDQGPREGFVGDGAVADRNGDQLAFAALSALASLGPAGTDFHYAGPVVSGATVGTWKHVAHGEDRVAETVRFARRVETVDLPLKSGLSEAELQADLDRWLEAQAAADRAGEAVKARDCGARAERARRWLARVADLPVGRPYPLRYSVTRVGDAFWVATGGEPYSVLQRALRDRFPGFAVLVSPLSGDPAVAYLLPGDCYGKGLYQEEPSSLAQGCLERLTEVVSETMQEMAGA